MARQYATKLTYQNCENHQLYRSEPMAKAVEHIIVVSPEPQRDSSTQ